MGRKNWGAIGSLLIVTALITVLVWQPWQAKPSQNSNSTYIGQLTSPVRGLSSQEVDDLLNGRGAGYARTADLNNYPGPTHILSLKNELNLTQAQINQIETVFKQMQAAAKELGDKIVSHEKMFSAAFAVGTISEEGVKVQSVEIAGLYGELRAIHLQAHVQITPLLTTGQIAKYNLLRGYTSTPNSPTQDTAQHSGH